MEVITLHELRRGCGFRHSGKDGYGLYLIGDAIFSPCERLPFPIHRCPTCSGGIKFSRGFTWITPSKLFAEDLKPVCVYMQTNTPSEFPNHMHQGCLMCDPPVERQGLLWVGEKFYSVSSFMNEALNVGISKRIACLPRGFRIGVTSIYLAHNEAVPGKDGEDPTPGVFTAFTPRFLDIVVDTTNIEELPARAKELSEKFGERARLVKIEKAEQKELFQE